MIRWSRAGLAVAVGLTAIAVAVPTGSASSHREAPLTAADPQIDSTDLYAFVSPDAADTVTLISNWIPFQEPAGGPNFYLWGEDVRYNINVDNNGDAVPDVIYRWTFETTFKNQDTFLYNTGPVETLSDPDLNFVQTYDLVRVKGGESTTLVDGAIAAPSNVGRASMPDYAKLRDEAVVDFAEGEGRSFVGQADDPFFLDLRVFDLLYGADLGEVGRDTLDGYNVNALAIQVPKNDLAAGDDAGANPIVGVWTTAERPAMRVSKTDGSVDFSGDFVQVSRLGSPLVNEVVVPVGSKDAFSASKPSNDAQFLAKVQDPEVPKLIEKIYDIPAPATPRQDLVSVFLTGIEGATKPPNVKPSEMLRLNMSVAPVAAGNRLGVIGGDTAGFPNGRRLSDDVVDIELQVLEGELLNNPNDLGDGVNANDLPFGTRFPYLALPHSGSGGGATQSAGSGGAPQGAGSGAGASSSRDSAGSGQAAAQPSELPRGEASVPVGGVGAGAGGTASDGGLPVVPVAVAVTGLLLAAAGGVVVRRAVRS